MKKILKFFSPTCGPCKAMSRNIAELKDIEVQEIDISEESNMPLLDKYKVRIVPTTIILDEEGNVFKEIKGVASTKRLQTVINGGQTATD